MKSKRISRRACGISKAPESKPRKLPKARVGWVVRDFQPLNFQNIQFQNLAFSSV